jgi:predicted secreted protein
MFDASPAGVAFVAHCLLNQNAEVDGGARCAGVYSPLVEALREHGWRIEQMPCPELAFGGLQRFWAVREQYDTAAFRRHCRRLAAAVAGAIAVHARQGEKVVLVGLEGSPSMGVCVTSSDPRRGGRPEWPDGSGELTPGQGIFIEELRAELARLGVVEPLMTGITHQLPGHDGGVERDRLAAFLGKDG